MATKFFFANIYPGEGWLCQGGGAIDPDGNGLQLLCTCIHINFVQ